MRNKILIKDFKLIKLKIHQRFNSTHQDLTFHFRFLFSKYFSLVKTNYAFIDAKRNPLKIKIKYEENRYSRLAYLTIFIEAIQTYDQKRKPFFFRN